MFAIIVFLSVFITTSVHGAVSCDAGYYPDSNDECVICPAGYYCPAGTLSPYECHSGYEEGVIFFPGATDLDDCKKELRPGYAAQCMEDSVSVYQCRAGYYCPGGFQFTTWRDFSNCGRTGSWLGELYCPDGTYSDDGAVECTQCPPDNTVYADSCDVFYGEMMCEENVLDTHAGVESCAKTNVVRIFASPESAMYNQFSYDPTTMANAHGNVIVSTSIDVTNGSATYHAYATMCDYGYSPLPGAEDISGTGVVINSVSDAIDGICVPAGDIFGDIPDGTICSNYIGGCMSCADGLGAPQMVHSDGTRTLPTDCYAVTNPGYYIQMDPETYAVYETECVSGDYCPGGIRVRVNMETNSIGGGNISCLTLGDVYSMSDSGSASPNACYTTCDADSEPVYYPNGCSTEIQCEPGYMAVNNTCYQICNIGISQLKTSTNLSFTLFSERITTPSLNVSYNNSVCYAPLFAGSATNSINIRYNDKIYHLEQ